MRNLQTFNFETVTVDVQGSITNRKANQAKFISEDLGSGAILDMVAIPGGSFVMGSPNTEAGRDNSEGPQRTVNISPFFMGKYEVTQEQYQAVMGNNPAYFKGAKHPVEQVSWNDAVEFCEKVSRKISKTYRLPSESEWEYACRAGTTTPFYFGETITPGLVNYNGSSSPYGAASKGLDRQQTTDVGSFPPNSFGLYDMHGNVWEWCADPNHANYQGAPQDGRVWDEISNDNRYNDYLLVNIKNDNRNRLMCGGSWYSNPGRCRSAVREVDGQIYGFFGVGFRVVCVAP